MFIVFASTDPNRVRGRFQAVLQSLEPSDELWRDSTGFGLGFGCSTALSLDSTVVAAGNVTLRAPKPSIAVRGPSDLQIALHASVSHEHRMSNLNGRFSFVAWDRRRRALAAWRDPLGLATAYWSLRDGGILLSDSLETFADGSHIDQDCVAEFIANGKPGRLSTIWKGVQQVPPGSSLHWVEGRVDVRPFFSWAECRVDVPSTPQECAAECRRLMIESVGGELDEASATWSDLSGGHDSSSVTSIGAWLGTQGSPRQLGGCVTFVDSIGNGDESRFAGVVTRKYGLRSITIQDPWPWQSDGVPPPLTSTPTRDYPFWTRDYQVATRLKAEGGSSVMSGVGPDYYLPLTPAYAIDLLSTGEFADGLAVLRDWTLQHRSTFWRVLGREIAIPMTPPWLQAQILRSSAAEPAWLRPEFLKATKFDLLQVTRDIVSARLGAVCAERVEQRLSEIGSGLTGWRGSFDMDVRHPLLNMPLVRFCLSLGRELRTNFSHPKPVLRLAMRGIVPQDVLDRQTKGSLVLPRVCWAFGRERERLLRLLREPILGDLGVIEPRSVLAEIDACANGARSARHLYFLLSLETWLSARHQRGFLLAA